MFPVFHEVDYCNPDMLLSAFEGMDGFCFLDSARHDKDLGRYSYIVADPFLLLSSKNGEVTIGDETVVSDDPFAVLKKQLAEYQSIAIPFLPPFQGGVVGYFGYDLLHHLEAVDRPAQDVIDVPDMKLGFYDCVLAFDHHLNKAWVIATGFPNVDGGQRIRRAHQKIEWMCSIIEKKVKFSPAKLEQSLDVKSNFTQQAYCDVVQKTIDYIYAGDIFQANITQCFSTKLPENFSAFDLYGHLRESNPAPFSALLYFDDVKVVSSSPERFIQLQDGRVETRPIKGTKKRSHDAAVDKALADELLQSEKDCAENTMIVDLMRNDLSRVCEPGSVNVKKLCGLESYETVHHLVSVVEAKLCDNYDAIDLLKATFPGGSITGAPKIRAMEIIYEIEPTSRGVYCGSVGYIGFDGSMDTSIVIRTYVINENNCYFQAGGGIVSDSDPAQEYEESLAKAYALNRLLAVEEVAHDLAY